jgi:CubicO group peptidase (beta-lactamase class C family)
MRTFDSLRRLGAGPLLCVALVFSAAGVSAQTPTTGQPVPELARFDTAILALMDEYDIPGAALAVARDGRLVLARGYGFADRDAGTPVQPTSVFRIASLSKVVTAVTIMKLFQEGRLNLDDRVVNIVPGLTPTDSRFNDITVRHLLQHSGGWDYTSTPDPLFNPRMVANALGVASPPSRDEILRFVTGSPLQFNPGTKHSYTNFGFVLLGHVIESVTGQPYEKYVRENVLGELGISCMKLGSSLPGDRARGEVEYYDFPGASTVQSLFSNATVARPDGGFYLESFDAMGGWISTAPDLLRFLGGFDGNPLRPDILTPATIAVMNSRPSYAPNAPAFYALGINVRPVQNGGYIAFHAGSLPGTVSYLVRLANGTSYAVIFNSRPQDDTEFIADIDRELFLAQQAVTSWPQHDLFSDNTCSAASRRRPARR